MKHSYVLALVMVAGLSGCSGLKLFNEGRLKVATETKKQAQKLSEVNVFGTMEKNLDALTDLENDSLKLLRARKKESYLKILPERTAPQLASDLVSTISIMQGTAKNIKNEVAKAVENVNAQLDRQALVTDILKVESIPALIKKLQTALKIETNDKKKTALDNRIRLLTGFQSSEDPAVKRTISITLKRIKNTLEWVNGKADKTIKAFEKITGGADKAPKSKPVSLIKDMAKGGGDKVKKAKEWLAKLSKPLDDADKDQNVVAARNLLILYVKEQLAKEQVRLEEYRRYMAAIKRINDQFVPRNKRAICQLYLRAFDKIAAASSVNNDVYMQLIAQYKAFESSESYKAGECGYYYNDLNKKQSVEYKDWMGGQRTLSQYLVANIKREPTRPSGPIIVTALGLLSFVETPYADDLYDQILIEKNRHTIRLSAINYGQRSDLIRDLASSLEIYEQSGFKPKDVAEALLSATQIGALLFIGAKQ